MDEDLPHRDPYSVQQREEVVVPAAVMAMQSVRNRCIGMEKGILTLQMLPWKELF